MIVGAGQDRGPAPSRRAGMPACPSRSGSPPRAAGRPLLPTLHPAYLLRQPGEKAKCSRCGGVLARRSRNPIQGTLALTFAALAVVLALGLWLIRPSPEDPLAAYVAIMGGSEIAVVDLESAAVTSSIGVGQGPRHLVISPDGQYLYTAATGDNAVAVFRCRHEGGNE